GGIEASNGHPARLLGFVNDVSVRKDMELEKEHLYRELEQIITAVDQFAVTATLNLDGNIQATNELFCQFCGREEDELIGRSFSTLLMASQGESPAGDIWQSVCEGKPWQGHVSLCETGGEERIANASLSPHLDDNAEINAFVFIGIDITARAAARRALEVSIEAHRKSNEDLQMFAHIVSHDLQEPLRMVSSFMTLLERRYALELNPEAREFIQFAVEGATRMRSLLDGLLEFSRVQSRSLELKPVDLNASVAGAIANLMVLISERGAEINVTSLPEVQGDAAQLMQLLQNLIANGIKFCRDRSPKMDISAYREDGHWRVRVSDNGIGIEPAHYGKIFQMFQRLHSREEFPGTGVGLAVCKRIMERHGGSIEVESLQGQGSTFTLIF
ncbi:MAG TPA: ATP-binding protein, partial [Xanthomonadales bacterium]|nr:ATP-binding protein [Xanthomonadales bacterium]